LGGFHQRRLTHIRLKYAIWNSRDAYTQTRRAHSRSSPIQSDQKHDESDNKAMAESNQGSIQRHLRREQMYTMTSAKTCKTIETPKVTIKQRAHLGTIVLDIGALFNQLNQIVRATFFGGVRQLEDNRNTTAVANSNATRTKHKCQDTERDKSTMSREYRPHM
jgi:hypothetical protein